MNEQPTTPQPEHQVIADGDIIYEGPDWQQAFLLASRNAEYGTIVHLADGERGATWGPPVYKPQ